MFFLNRKAAITTRFRDSHRENVFFGLVTKFESKATPALHRDPTRSNIAKNRLEYTNMAEFYTVGKRYSIFAITLHLNKPMPPMLFDLPADKQYTQHRTLCVAMKDASKWRALPDTVPDIGHGALIGARKLRKYCHKAPARNADPAALPKQNRFRGQAQAGVHFEARLLTLPQPAVPSGPTP